MTTKGRKNISSRQRLWAFCCSLKLAVTLASLATLLIMGGSLVMHFTPEIFAGMEQEVMSIWLPWAWKQAPRLTWWVPLSGLCVFLFGVNTLCCFIDWLGKIRARWRKTGEYLIHAGFVLLVTAYAWGSVAGFRSGPHQIFPGERIDIPRMPGLTLQLDKFTPKMEPSGRPLDMINQLSLWKGPERVATAEVRINHPLIYDGLVILPTSFGQDLQGFRFNLRGQGLVDLTAGSSLPLSPQTTLVVEQLLPDALQNSQGRVMQVGTRLNNPALLISVKSGDTTTWQGWYFLRGMPPGGLIKAGVFLRPVEPIFRTFSLLTINRDPGDKLAMLGGILISIGVIFAFFSFYRKRAVGDRPEV